MSLRQTLPWTKNPLIINAPMGGFAGPDLAIAVSRAGGLGQIGSLNDPNVLSAQLDKVEQTLDRTEDLLPVGVGLLPFITKLDDMVPIFENYRPAVIWLFAAQELNDYTTWTDRLRQASPKSQVWIQVGSVEAALHIARSARPDVMCVQGGDAGGHGFEKGAGIISLLPEVSDALAKEGLRIPLVAAGGVADGRGVAAALALGANGVVMGTRFLSAPETQLHPAYRAAVLAASDGGQTTTRTKLFDELKGPNVWPGLYDGRGIVMESYHDHAGGVHIEEIRRRHAEAATQDGGYGSHGKGRTAMWAGTGVGLVTKEQGAGEIVAAVQEEALKVLKDVASRV